MRLFVLLAFVASPIWACSCAGQAPACQVTWNPNSAVFMGTVLDITGPPPAEQAGVVSAGGRVVAGSPIAGVSRRHMTVRFDVTEAVTGINSGQKTVEIETGMGGGDCGYRFEMGTAYVVYAYRSQNGSLETSICSRTRPLSEAAEDVSYFRSVAEATPGGEVRMELHDSDNFGDGTAGIHITVEGGGRRYEATTGPQGQASITGIPQGEYRLRGTLDGYLPFERTVQLHDKGCAQVFQVMGMDRRVMGRVLGKDGQPALGVTVAAVPVRPPNLNNALPFAADSAQTDAQGNYELSHLRVGDYYLGVNISNPPGRNSPYRRWFYPGVEDPKLATTVHIAHAPGTQQLDFSLPARLPAGAVQGTLILPNGQPAANARVYLVDPHVPWRFSENGTRTDAEGRFQLQGINGTDCQIYATWSSGVRREEIRSQLLDVPWGGDTLHVRLVLNSQGPTMKEWIDQALEHWRQGLGL